MRSIIDTWAYYGYSDGTRQLVIDGDDYIGAGTRLQENFRYAMPHGGRVRRIDLGESPKEAYAALEAAFNNKLKAPVEVAPKKKLLVVSSK